MIYSLYHLLWLHVSTGFLPFSQSKKRVNQLIRHPRFLGVVISDLLIWIITKESLFMRSVILGFNKAVVSEGKKWIKSLFAVDFFLILYSKNA